MRSNDKHNVKVITKSSFATPTGLPDKEDTKSSDLCAVVLYAEPESTKEAVRYAATLGHGLSMNLSLVDIEVVPYGYPLDRPPIDSEFARRRLECLAQECGVSLRGEVIYARDREEALMRWLKPGSLVLIPVKGFFGRMGERLLMRNLIKHGHDVVLVPCK